MMLVRRLRPRLCSTFERADGSPIDITPSLCSGGVGGAASSAFASRWETIFAQKKQTRRVTEIFSTWADDNRDEQMHMNHASAVETIVAPPLAELAGRDGTAGFRFLDAGCGNGWLVRSMAAREGCAAAVGLDGSEAMVAKARALSSSAPAAEFFHSPMEEWSPSMPFDFVFSMEVLYYQRDPTRLLSHMRTWLKPNGVFAAGLDFFEEHEASHAWPVKTGLPMTLLSAKQWRSALQDAGFRDATVERVDNTLALHARR
jgi:SAM-dependent methyltransferase